MMDKKIIFESLNEKLAFNRKQIAMLKKVVMSLALLFVLISFGLFYSTSILISGNKRLITFFTIVLGLLFLSLIGIQFFKKNKEKENRDIDTQIYELLKLKI